MKAEITKKIDEILNTKNNQRYTEKFPSGIFRMKIIVADYRSLTETEMLSLLKLPHVVGIKTLRKSYFHPFVRRNTGICIYFDRRPKTIKL